jgi:hypothetical protein
MMNHIFAKMSTKYSICIFISLFLINYLDLFILVWYFYRSLIWIKLLLFHSFIWFFLPNKTMHSEKRIFVFINYRYLCGRSFQNEWVFGLMVYLRFCQSLHEEMILNLVNWSQTFSKQSSSILILIYLNIVLESIVEALRITWLYEYFFLISRDSCHPSSSRLYFFPLTVRRIFFIKVIVFFFSIYLWIKVNKKIVFIHL